LRGLFSVAESAGRFKYPARQHKPGSGSFDSIDRTGIDTSGTISAEPGIDNVLFLAFTDRVNRTGRQAGTTVDALIIDSMSQRNHLLYLKLIPWNL